VPFTEGMKHIVLHSSDFEVVGYRVQAALVSLKHLERGEVDLFGEAVLTAKAGQM
jgi:hypothetical protein